MGDSRQYDPERDLDAIARIWREVGWIDDSDAQAEGLRIMLSRGRVRVAEIDCSAECAVQWTPGRLRYLDDDLELCAVTAVTTSRIARKQGLASRLTAQALCEGAGEGAEVAALGMFEQGFYDRLGFGSGGYDHRFALDPAALTVQVPERPAVRLSSEDSDEIHDLFVRRHRCHGGVVITEPTFIEAELHWLEKMVALGYRNAEGRLTHAFLGRAKGESDAVVDHIFYETPAQCLEVLGLIRGLGDQWVTVTLGEPAVVQLQDLMTTPIRQRMLRRHASLTSAHQSVAWWQARILDLESCVERCRWAGEPVRFVLRLHDPLSDREGLGWPGLSGEWVITIGEESSAEPGSAADLDVLEAGVGAFTRMWLGVRSASSLALSDDLSGPDELLGRLDQALCLPRPHPGLYF